jgi:4-aminobutyrate aminotransferase
MNTPLRASVRVPPPGPRSLALLERLQRSVARANNIGLYGITLVSGEGSYVQDADGNIYLDCLGAASANILGYGRSDLVEAYSHVARRIQHSGCPYSPNPWEIELAEALTAASPWGGDARVLLGLSGSDANDGAIEAARRATGRSGLISCQGSYHGSTGLSQQASGFPGMNDGIFAPSPDFCHIPYPGSPEAAERASTQLEAALATGRFGALLMETVAGDAGVFPPSPGFFAQARQLCDRFDALLMLDEIQCGMGRTGSLLAFTQEGVEPDLYVLAKGLSAGYAPISAIVGRAAVMQSLDHGQQVFTYSGHAPSSAVARRVLQVLQEDQLPARAAVLGEHIIQRLRELAERYPSVIKAVRGRGLMIGVEIDCGAETGRFGELSARVFATRGVELGVYFGYIGLNKEVVRIEPALTSSQAEAEQIVQTIASVAAEFVAGSVPARTLENVKRYSVGL